MLKVLILDLTKSGSWEAAIAPIVLKEKQKFVIFCLIGVGNISVTIIMTTGKAVVVKYLPRVDRSSMDQ